MMAERIIRLFGEPEVTVDGAQVRLGTSLPLLALLVLWRRRDEIRVEDAAELLHPDRDESLDRADGASEPKAASFLRKRKASLRDKLRLDVSGGQTLTDLARLLPGLAWVDVARFDALAENDDPASLREAVALRGRGPLLAGWEPSYFPIVEEARQSREKKYQQALARLIEMERRDRPWEALRFLELLIAADGVSDKRAAELQGLRSELNREAEKTLAPSHNLPTRVSTFIGRERELATVKALVAEHRLVTLTGAGGCGKSRLALQVATELAAGRNSIFLVELAPLATPEHLPQTIGRAVGLTDTQGEVDTPRLIESLKSQRLMLVLDNCEHLISGCAALVDQMLLACPGLSVLATSREPLDIDGEKVSRIPSLAFPDPASLPLDAPDPAKVLLHYDAVRLFCERARLHSEFALGPDTLAPVAVLCKRLDGIPLALELAAARIGDLSVTEMVAYLDDRFRLLAKGRRNAPPRHATLRAAINWSYDLLTEAERALFIRLSVFVGGWTQEAAQAVSPDGWTSEDVSHCLGSLTRRSLISAEPENAPSRYGMLETVREYAQERCSEQGRLDQTRIRHRDFYYRFSREANPHLHGPDQVEWNNRLEEEHGNLRAALGCYRQFRDGDEEWLRMGAALWWFWWVRGYLTEALSSLETALTCCAATASADARARAMEGAGVLAMFQGDYQTAETYQSTVLTLNEQMGSQPGMAAALCNLGLIAERQCHYRQAEGLFSEALRLERALGNQGQVAGLLDNLGYAHKGLGQHRLAEERHRESLALRREIGDTRGIANSLTVLGSMTIDRGEYGAAKEMLEESLALQEQLGYKSGVALARLHLGRLSQAGGDYASAHKGFQDGLALYREAGEDWGVADATHYLAKLALEEGQYTEAERLYEDSLLLMRGMDDAENIADLLTGLAKTARRQCDREKAHRWLAEGLEMTRTLENLVPLTRLIEERAFLAMSEGYGEGAVRLLSAAESLADQLHYRRPAQETGHYDQEVADIRKTLGQGVFSVAWKQGQTMTGEQAVEFALNLAEMGTIVSPAAS